MLGEASRLAGNLWYIQGEMPTDSSKAPDPCNVVIYWADSRLYLIDSSCGLGMRASIERVVREAGPLESFTLINTHSHLDHICNNDLIETVDARTRHHYVLGSGISAEKLDAPEYFAEQFDKMDEYYDPFTSYQAYRAKYAFAAFLRDALGILVGRKRVLKALFALLFKKFAPIGDSRRTMEPIEALPGKSVTLGGETWKAWALGHDEVIVLEGRAHSDDEVFVYIPEHRILCVGDLNFPLFPTWANSDKKRIVECLKKALSMTRAGMVDILADGHGDRCLRSKKDIEELLERTIADHLEYEGILREILEREKGLTPGEIYERFKLDKVHPVVEKYLRLEFPRTPGSLQNVMVTTLLQMGARAEGRRRHRRFFMDAG